MQVDNPFDWRSTYVLEQNDTSTGGRVGYFSEVINESSFVLEVDWQRSSESVGDLAICIKEFGSDYGYKFRQGDYASNHLSILKVNVISATLLAEIAYISRAPDTNWHRVKVIYDNGSMRFEQDEDVVSATDTTYSGSWQIAFYVGSVINQSQ